KAIERRGTESLEAYDLYLMARQQQVAGNAGDPAREDAIIRLCRRAIEIDPNYARAWALSALAQWSLRFMRGRAGDDGLAAAEKAISLDPDLAEPHVVKSRILFDRGFRDQGMAELEIGFGLDPQSELANQTAAHISMREKRTEDAIRYYEAASALNESDIGSPAILMSCYGAIGDQEGARRAARVTLARVEKAVALDRTNGFALGFGVGALATLGETQRARDWIRRALLIDPDNLLMRYNLACSLSVDFQDVDAAIEMLRPVFAKISVNLLGTAKSDSDLDLLRKDPRFQAMVADAEARLAAEGDTQIDKRDRGAGKGEGP
ncbi:MAG: TPR end-of-group domain-containing protein, partial [Caulobacteraceae bacterium]